MKMTDYVAAKMADPSRGFFGEWRIGAWGLWALLVKRETFYVKDLEEALTLETNGGQLLRLFSGLLTAVGGVLKMLFSLLAIVWLVFLLLISPIGILGMRVAAMILARRHLRRRAKLLAEARAGMGSRTNN